MPSSRDARAHTRKRRCALRASSLMYLQRLLLALLVTVQCRPVTSTDAGLTAPAASSAASTSSADATSTIPARMKPTTREIVDAWNLAHTKHDVGALESLYAAQVAFYGQTLTNKQCVDKKK